MIAFRLNSNSVSLHHLSRSQIIFRIKVFERLYLIFPYFECFLCSGYNMTCIYKLSFFQFSQKKEKKKKERRNAAFTRASLEIHKNYTFLDISKLQQLIN